MKIQPSLEEVQKLATEGNTIPVYAEMSADLLTPVSVYLKLGASANSFLFESVLGGFKIGRYSFVGSGNAF